MTKATELPTVKLTFTIQQFNKLKANLKRVVANLGYIPHRNLSEIKAPANKPVVVEFNLDQYNGLKNALATLDTATASDSLDIVFDQGEPQFFEIMTKLQADQQAQMQAAAQAASGDANLKPVTVEDINKARAKAKKAAAKKTTKSKKKVG